MKPNKFPIELPPRIAKYLLLGHSKREIERDLMPRFHSEGGKKVKVKDVSNVLRVMNAPRIPVHHKLREGLLDAMSLVARDDGDNCLRGVYPWPTVSEKSPSLQNTMISEASSTTIVKSRIKSRRVKRSGDETEEAVANILEVSPDGDAADGDPVADYVDGDDAFVEHVSEQRVSNQNTPAHSQVEAVADDAIDPDAFRVRQQFLLNEKIYMLNFDCSYCR